MLLGSRLLAWRPGSCEPRPALPPAWPRPAASQAVEAPAARTCRQLRRVAACAVPPVHTRHLERQVHSRARGAPRPGLAHPLVALCGRGSVEPLRGQRFGWRWGMASAGEPRKTGAAAMKDVRPDRRGRKLATRPPPASLEQTQQPNPRSCPGPASMPCLSIAQLPPSHQHWSSQHTRAQTPGARLSPAHTPSGSPETEERREE